MQLVHRSFFTSVFSYLRTSIDPDLRSFTIPLNLSEVHFLTAV